MNLIVLTSDICCFMFLTCLSIIYKSKKNFSNEENRIYKWILICNFIVLLVEIFFMLSIYYIKENLQLIMILEKTYFIYILMWILIFTYYIIIISNENNKKINKFLHRNNKKNILVIISLFFIISIIILFLPLEHAYNNGYIEYSYGIAPNFMSFLASVMIFMSIFSIIINRKNLNKKKIIPIFAFSALMTLFYIIHMFYPNVLLISLSITLISNIMYFTIENPDMKMLREIQKSKEFAEQANTEKAMFLYNTSQELKSPVNAISQRCEELLQEQDINEIINGIKDIKFAAKRLSSTISGTLDMNKTQATNIEIKVSRYQAKMLLQEMISISKLNMKEKSLDFRVNLDDNIPEYLMGDSIRLKQIITTIMNNAIKHTESGFIEFSVSSVIKHDVCRLIITIEDSGSGIESKKLETLFYNKDDDEVLDEEKLNNVGDTRERLSVIKILTNLIGGTVIVNSELGRGSKFTVVLDQQIAETKKTSTMKAIEKLSSNKRILVVDDEEESLKQITKVLNKYDINVDTVEWGQECLEKIRNKQKYDLILLDEDMPRLNGIKTFEKLKIEDNFNIPVVIMINSNHIDYKDRYLYNGFSGCIVKPIKKTDIDKILKKFVNED